MPKNLLNKIRSLCSLYRTLNLSKPKREVEKRKKEKEKGIGKQICVRSSTANKQTEWCDE